MMEINYISNIVGNASCFITGKLMEMIDEDVYSETEKERNEINEKEMNISFVAFMNELKFKTI